MKYFYFPKRTAFFALTILTISAIQISPVYAVEDNVDVSVSVPGCVLELTVKPEKRIPATNNWDTILNVEVYRSNNTLLKAFTTNTDTTGKSTIDLCDLGAVPVPDTYNFYLKGYSHLRKKFASVTTFQNYYNTVDFTTGGIKLLAGEVSPADDNYINIFDFSAQVKKLYTNDYKTDLNQDGIVNSLDISNTIYNFYKTGD